MTKRKKKAASSAEMSEASNVAPTETAPTGSHDAPEISEKREESPRPEQNMAAGDWVSRTQSDPEPKDVPGCRPSYPDPNVPFSIAHNNQVGLRLLKSDRFKQVQLAFSSPVSGGIEEQLVAAGWKYRPEEKVHTKQYSEKGAAVSIEEARRFYNDLVDQLGENLGKNKAIGR